MLPRSALLKREYENTEAPPRDRFVIRTKGNHQRVFIRSVASVAVSFPRLIG